MATFLGTLFLVICVLLIVVVLLQKGRGGGLGGTLGGGFGSSAFGSRTGDVFTWVTIVLTGLFLVLAVITTMAYSPAKVQIQTPMFDPPPGPTRSVVHVTITVPGEKPGTTVQYTTDGSDPKENSPVYTKNAIDIQPGMTLKAIAHNRGYLSSEIAVGQYLRPEDYMDANISGAATKPAAHQPRGRRPATMPAGTTLPAAALAPAASMREAERHLPASAPASTPAVAP